jgi:N-acetylneuraminate synthase
LRNLDDICEALGTEKKIITEEEKKNIFDLQRGVFSSKKIKKGTLSKDAKIYFAFPKINKQQISPEDLSNQIIINTEILPHKALIGEVKVKNKYLVRKYLHRYKFMLNECGINPGEDARIELSHHYGLENIDKYGALLITVINGIYCKKIVALFANQTHPKHKHLKKIETFQILWGDLKIEKEDIVYNLRAGDKLDVFNNEWHSFSSNGGCIFEEISTESLKMDSIYSDSIIQHKDLIERKTIINW